MNVYVYSAVFNIAFVSWIFKQTESSLHSTIYHTYTYTIAKQALCSCAHSITSLIKQNSGKSNKKKEKRNKKK